MSSRYSNNVTGRYPWEQYLHTTASATRTNPSTCLGIHRGIRSAYLSLPSGDECSWKPARYYAKVFSDQAQYAAPVTSVDSGLGLVHGPAGTALGVG